MLFSNVLQKKREKGKKRKRAGRERERERERREQAGAEEVFPFFASRSCLFSFLPLSSSLFFSLYPLAFFCWWLIAMATTAVPPPTMPMAVRPHLSLRWVICVEFFSFFCRERLSRSLEVF